MNIHIALFKVKIYIRKFYTLIIFSILSYDFLRFSQMHHVCKMQGRLCMKIIYDINQSIRFIIKIFN